jgi:hypothetical protein
MWILHYSLFKQGLSAFLPPLMGLAMLLFIPWGIWVMRSEPSQPFSFFAKTCHL